MRRASMGLAGSRRIVEDAREAIADMLGANLGGRTPDRVIFTSGGTESNNLALFGLAGQSSSHLIVSAIEHPSVVGPIERLTAQAWRVEVLGADGEGVVERWRIARPVADGSETFRRHRHAWQQRDRRIAAGRRAIGVCRDHGVPMHTDAVQVVGKLPVNFQRLGVATLSFSAHKFHGPRGIGGLLVRGDVELQPLLYGGFQQAGLRPGTEPVALIAGMHKALEIWQREAVERRRRMTALRDRFEAALRSHLPGTVVNGSRARLAAYEQRVVPRARPPCAGDGA